MLLIVEPLIYQNKMKKIYVTLADTEEKRAQGLMWKKSIGKNEGMLFRFPRLEKQCFWMKNTYIPLDLCFLDDDFKIFQIEEMIPLSTKKIISCQKCRMALELPFGWCKDNNLCVGNKLNVSEDFFKKNNFKFAQTEGEAEGMDAPLIDNEVPEDFDGGLDPESLPDGIDIPEEGQQEGEEDSAEDVQIDRHSPIEDADEEIDDNVRIMRNKRDILKQAEIDQSEIEILYWTLSGHILPPRRIVPNEGRFLIKNGPNGDYLVAFDKSPTISGGTWQIKGNQPKSFIIDNIINLEVIEDETKSQYEIQEEKRESFWDKLKKVF